MTKIKIYGKKPCRTSSGERLAKRAVFAAVAEFLGDTPARVDITMVSAAEMREINNESRGVDSVTDVLSFPMLNMYRGCYSGDILKEREPDSGCVMLGDIIICYDKVLEQAEQLGHSIERECGYLAVHSALHLLGFDHIDEAEEKAAMREAEEKIMKKMEIDR